MMIKTSKMRETIVILCTCLLVVSECIGYFYPPVFWHYQNCVFRKLTESYGTNATKEYFMKVLPYNKVRIVCPSQITVNDWRSNQITFLKYQNLWMVDKNGYDSCKVNDDTNPTMNKKILTCNSPSTISYKEFQFHPKYNSEEPRFAPGRHYYFIATGDGKIGKLNAKSGGHCKKYHMKLHIYVCDPTKEDCVWNLPECEPTYEFKRVMTEYSRSLPPPTREPVILPPPPTTTKQPTTIASTKPITTQNNGMVGEQKKGECKEENDDGASVHMILNFVMGGVILFMAVVIVILACGLARKSDRTRPASGTFSVIAAQEPNANLYQESARFVQPPFTPTSKSPPQTPISINPPFYLAPMAEIRPRSSSNKNGHNNAVYGRRQDSTDVSSVQVEAAPMLSDNYPNPPEPV